MPAIFVHGVPETSALWNGVRAHLGSAGGDAVAVDLSGFGAERPAGFTSTKDAYAAWLAEALQGIGGPIDLVGHDWGAGLVLRAVTGLGVPVRSWAVDVAAVFHPDYVWHDIAQVWQTPGVGEKRMAETRLARRGDRGEIAAMLLRAGAPEADAEAMQAAYDETMGECILALYRSAVPNPFADWGAQLVAPTSGAGLVLQATADEFDDEAASTEMATRLGARTERLDGLGHWWMLQDPAAAATALTRFWATLT
ncbi:alpha/beta fold hydrolase [Pseudonocardia sp. TRM90224]|uniref:alpha/beta fold hydrolase n=1 Tax=Pseudonocardia sp. TRM90224 TaxID=2812678 RepID=UPI001E4157BE|nr:alpha/beta hydrolase [Pseudonocardia sp. TRM90224]